MTPEEWKPIGVDELEDIAMTAVKSNTNQLVIAGPGAGKTELLAQKACFLLQTNTCPYPKKILALTFKVDAAKNIKNRVDNRIERYYSNRFISETYDAFFMRLLKQFYNCLPEEWKIFTEINPQGFNSRANEERSFLDGCADSRCTLAYLQGINENELEKDYLINKPLNEYDSTNIDDYISLKLWKTLLKLNRPTFSMISRLVEFIIDSNSFINKCLKLTYKNIFIDEFQDTTTLQYSIIKKMFNSDLNIISAVGDDKQKIMTFAGAMPEIFKHFQNDFQPTIYKLKNNYRSIPALVEIQNSITTLFSEPLSFIPAQKDNWEIKDPCKLFICENEINEAIVISKYIKHLLNDCNPTDICILIRWNGEQYTKALLNTLKKEGIKIRFEDKLQSLLKEPVIILICSIIRISFSFEYKTDYSLLKSYFLKYISLIDFDKKTNEIIKKIRESSTAFDDNLITILEYLNISFLEKSFIQYKKTNHLKSVIKEFSEYINNNLGNMTLLESVNDLLGNDYIPLMTIHKSKGLEFDNIILIGLEDNSFFDYINHPEDENCAFFVAFSRAKKRVVFTIAKNRTNKWGQIKQASITTIRPIIEVIQKSAQVETDSDIMGKDYCF